MTLLAASHVRIFDVFGILGQALLPAVFMNIAIVGLNQVYDKRIDMVLFECASYCININLVPGQQTVFTYGKW